MFTFNGIGTTLYGVSNVDKSEGSYVSTKWIVFAWLPIIPLASYKIIPGESKSVFIYYHSQKVQLIKVKINWKQIGKTYLKVYGTAAVVFGLIFLLSLAVRSIN